MSPAPTTEGARREGGLLFLLVLFFYLLTNFGGVRSPDGEIVFQSGEALAARGTLAVDGMAGWPGFGVAPGRDGRNYPVFGPLQSILLAPVIAGGSLAGFPRWFDGASAVTPVSFNVGDGLTRYVRGIPPPETGPHALRALSSYLNALLGALGVLLLWLILRRSLGVSGPAAAFTALVYAFGTLGWTYAGSDFSEPLAVLLLLCALALLLGRDGAGERGTLPLLGAGLALGASTAAHITSILFFPFLAAYVLLRGWRRGGATIARLRPAILFACGFAAVLLLLGWYDAARFGDILETGRTVDPEAAAKFGYGHFVAPWQGLVELTVGVGKGLLWYCPGMFLGLLGARALYRRDRDLALLLGGAVLFRLVFIAARSDWHGGFSLGPRYLVAIIPLVLLPFGLWLDERRCARGATALRAAGVAALLCVLQQLAFVLGETISSYHVARFLAMKSGVNPFTDWAIYRDAAYAPLFHALDGARGPLLLRGLPVANGTLFLAGAAIMTLLGAAAYRAFENGSGEGPPAADGAGEK